MKTPLKTPLKAFASCIALCAVVLLSSVAWSGPDSKKDNAKDGVKDSAKDVAKDSAKTPNSSASFDAIKALVGTWEMDNAGSNGKHDIVEFRLTANKSVVIETMFPGSPHEMVNTYHMNGDDLMVTHYCAQGVQPRMKMAHGDASTMQFEFVDCSNLKEGEGCMGGLEMQTDGEKLIEKWYYRTGDKLGEPDSFEFHRKK